MRPLDFLGRIKVKLGLVIVLAVATAFVVNEVGINSGLSREVRIAVAVALALIMVQVLARGMTKPLREMAAAVQVVAKGRYELRVRSTSRDEVGELARAFNAMAADLGEVDRQRRELIANVSHELRTPITGLRAVLENVVDGVSAPDPGTLGTALAQTERLSRLVTQLLDLSRLDSGARPIEPEAVALGPLFDQVVREAALARDDVRFAQSAPTGLAVRADPDMLAQVLANLLDNAVRHSPRDGVVTLTASAEGTGIRMVVADQGTGIPEAARSRVFERFSRLDAARAADAGGSGLGLAIVKEIIELHEGSIHIDGGAGCRMVVDLPRRLMVESPPEHPPALEPALLAPDTTARAKDTTPRMKDTTAPEPESTPVLVSSTAPDSPLAPESTPTQGSLIAAGSTLAQDPPLAAGSPSALEVESAPSPESEPVPESAPAPALGAGAELELAQAAVLAPTLAPAGEVVAGPATVPAVPVLVGPPHSAPLSVSGAGRVLWWGFVGLGFGFLGGIVVAFFVGLYIGGIAALITLLLATMGGGAVGASLGSSRHDLLTRQRHAEALQRDMAASRASQGGPVGHTVPVGHGIPAGQGIQGGTASHVAQGGTAVGHTAQGGAAAGHIAQGDTSPGEVQQGGAPEGHTPAGSVSPPYPPKPPTSPSFPPPPPYVPPPLFPKPDLPDAPRWLLAAVAGVGAFAAVALPYARAGLGIALVAVVMAVAVLPAMRRRFTPWTVAFGLTGLALVAMVALRDADWLVFPLVLAGWVLGALAVSGAGGGWLGAIRGGLSVLIAMLPVPWFLGQPLKSLSANRKVTPTLVAAAITVVLLVVFGLLFASADAVFASFVDRLLTAPDWAETLPTRVFIFALFAVMMAAAVLVAMRPVNDPATPSFKTTVSRSIWMVPLVALNLLFAAFVAVQVTALFGGNAKVLRTAGLTYADYARQGFFQLVVVSVFVLVIVGVASGVVRTGKSDRVLLACLLGVLCAFTLVILASALHRLGLYTGAYGLSRLRASVGATIWWLGAVFAMVLIAGAVRMRGGGSGWLPRAVVLVTGVGLVVFAVWNPDLRVAETQVVIRGVERMDQDYVGDLGAEAVPALDRLPEPLRSCVLADVVDANGLAGGDAWNGWNLARVEARALLAQRPIVRAGTCPGVADRWATVPDQD